MGEKEVKANRPEESSDDTFMLPPPLKKQESLESTAYMGTPELAEPPRWAPRIKSSRQQPVLPASPEVAEEGPICKTEDSLDNAQILAYESSPELEELPRRVPTLSVVASQRSPTHNSADSEETLRSMPGAGVGSFTTGVQIVQTIQQIPPGMAEQQSSVSVGRVGAVLKASQPPKIDLGIESGTNRKESTDIAEIVAHRSRTRQLRSVRSRNHQEPADYLRLPRKRAARTSSRSKRSVRHRERRGRASWTVNFALCEGRFWYSTRKARRSSGRTEDGRFHRRNRLLSEQRAFPRGLGFLASRGWIRGVRVRQWNSPTAPHGNALQ